MRLWLSGFTKNDIGRWDKSDLALVTACLERDTYRHLSVTECTLEVQREHCIHYLVQVPLDSHSATKVDFVQVVHFFGTLFSQNMASKRRASLRRHV